jgi:manganese/iron transport system ATP-binding protein/manganese/zinc/iron transport system ATP- binding protein
MPSGNDLTRAPAIAASAVTLAYEGGPPVLENLNLELMAGELVIALGPNGGGKTTLFKALVGELGATDGSLEVNATVAYLPQYDASRTDFPVSALDVVLMGTLPERRIWQRPGRSDRERARDALARVGLDKQADTTYGELSGGQRRRVLLARTIVRNAQVVVLDEPLAGVDPASSESIRATLEGLRDEGRLVLVASHDVDHARQSDRVLCLNKQLIANGDPATVLTNNVLRQTYASDLTIVTNADGIPIFAAAEHHHH